MLRIIINNYKTLGKIPNNLISFLKKTGGKNNIHKNFPYIFINLSNKLMNQSGGRFSYLFCSYLNKSNYKIVAKLNFIYFLFLHPYKKLLLNQDFIYVRSMNTAQNSLVVKTKERKKMINVALGLQTLNESFHYFLPFPMHPVQVDNYNIKILEEFRETKRKIRIFFQVAGHKINIKFH